MTKDYYEEYDVEFEQIVKELVNIGYSVESAEKTAAVVLGV